MIFNMRMKINGIGSARNQDVLHEADPEPYTLTSLRDGSGRQSSYQGYPEDKTDMRIY